MYNRVMVTPARSPQPLPASAPLQLDNQLCFALYSTSLTMTKLYKPVLERLGLTYPQYLVMLALWETSPSTVSALGERLFLDSGTLTPLLKRMQSAGWLKRERDTTDERRVIVALSDAGRALRGRAAEVPRTMVRATRCSLDELAELRQGLQALRRNLAAQLQSPIDAAD
jgi:MarR family transcriptional regulator, organic hydroperoxide resistance regulator